ncbi:unnamed protein product [Vitrella brassicaformis CCMP3155]|uniref:Uncharacterized protein n=2 Tax=Vitrella brassicaformis TaxID=1169539 RepID=A0A0G4GXK2_VITBC|nr:unnamed protein product [Vitrella brassicaformis CCMP3155]|eukprot:CEM35777.1 unnamed protein product [Vitrella brassicaformis CCMP3155]
MTPYVDTAHSQSSPVSGHVCEAFRTVSATHEDPSWCNRSACCELPSSLRRRLDALRICDSLGASSAGMFTDVWRWLNGLFATSSDASATVPAAHVPQHLSPTVAEYVRSYSQLEALIDAHPTQFTAAVLLPILERRLSAVVAAIFGGLVQVPLPQLTQGAATTALIDQLSRRLFILERGGDWDRWRPHLEMLYLLRGERAVVLDDDNFGVFGSRAAFLDEREAVRQWKILSWGVTVRDDDGQHRRLMGGNWIFRHSFHTSGFHFLNPRASASPVFPNVFDPANPSTELKDWTSPSYTSMVAFVLFGWLYNGDHIRWIKSWRSYNPASTASRRVGKLLATSSSKVAQRGAGAAVFDKKWSARVVRKGDPSSVPDGKIESHHRRLVVFGSEAMGERHMAIIWLSDRECYYPRDVFIYSTEPAPHGKTRTVVMRVLGEHLEGKVWQLEREVDEDRQATACTVM